MKRLEARLSLAVCATGALLMSSSALAGSTTHFPVLVDTVNMRAGGNLGSARNSGDKFQLLGCKLTVDGWGAYAFCVARNAQGSVASCSTDNPEMLAAIRAISGDSFIMFKWDNIGFCTEIVVLNGSETEPKL
jgi:hypothetical protein